MKSDEHVTIYILLFISLNKHYKCCNSVVCVNVSITGKQ